MRIRSFILILLALFALGGYGVGGIAGVFYAWMMIPILAAKAAEAMVVGYLLVKLHKVVKTEVSSPDHAFQAATRWWLIGYVVLCLWLVIIKGFWYAAISEVGLLQYPLAAIMTFPAALLAFYLKRWWYYFRQRNS